MTTKQCTKCNTTKPLTDYTRRTASTDGHAQQCRTCTNTSNTKSRAARKNTTPTPKNTSRTGEPWEPWEHKYLTDHPTQKAHQIAPHLKRTTSAIKLARYRRQGTP